jgi:hypothetical protein
MSIDYFAGSNPRVGQHPSWPPQGWTYQPPPRSRATRVGGRVIAGIAGCFFFVTVVLPAIMGLAMVVMMLAGGGLTF